MRIAVGESGILAKHLPCLCCSFVIPIGMEVEIDSQHSPKRVWVAFKIEAVQLSTHGKIADIGKPIEDGKWLPDPRMPFPSAHKFRHSGADRKVMEPPFFALHKVKASKIWFKENSHAIPERE